MDEAVYQKCIWLTGKQMKGYYREVWWNYIDKYYSYLTSANQTKNSSISKQILKQINAGAEFIQKTEKCYKNSFSIPDDKFNSENDVLRAEQSQKAYSHLSYIPGFFINGYLIRENLKVDIVVSAICDKLITQPDYCESFLTSRINLEYEKINVKNGFTWLILSLSFLCVFVLIIAIYAIKRCMREGISKEIEYQIDGYVSDYFRLESGKANLNV